MIGSRVIGALIRSIAPLLMFSHFSATQTASDYQVKAAYIYNFAKFIEWPASSFADPNVPFGFCILNDRSFEVELNRIVSGKSIAGRSVDVLAVQDGQQARSCQVLFINASHGRQTRRIVEALRGASVLTIGESDAFLQDGGIINFLSQDDRVQFSINRRAANEAGLRISSRLLGIARRVID